MAEMPFVSSLVQEDLPVWQQCLDTEFLRRMEDGTLDEACFKGYIVDCLLYTSPSPRDAHESRMPSSA